MLFDYYNHALTLGAPDPPPHFPLVIVQQCLKMLPLNFHLWWGTSIHLSNLVWDQCDQIGRYFGLWATF